MDTSDLTTIGLIVGGIYIFSKLSPSIENIDKTITSVSDTANYTTGKVSSFYDIIVNNPISLLNPKAFTSEGLNQWWGNFK